MAALPVIAAIASIGAGAATTYQALSQRPKGQPTPQPVQAQKPTDATEDKDAQAQRLQRARLAQQRTAATDTKQRDSVLTQGLGSAPVTQKSLLGL